MSTETFQERVTRERTEWRARVEEIAKAIGPEWKIARREGDEWDPTGYACITDGTARLILREGKRLEVSAYLDLPSTGLEAALREESSRGKFSGPKSITLDKSRAPDVLAREMHRRLIQHVPAWIAHLRTIKARQDTTTSVLERAKADAFKVAPGASEGRSDEEGSIWHPHAHDVRAWTSDEGEVSWRMTIRSVPHKMALRIFKILSELETT